MTVFLPPSVDRSHGRVPPRELEWIIFLVQDALSKKKRNQETASSGNEGNVSLFFTQYNESCSRHEYAKHKKKGGEKSNHDHLPFGNRNWESRSNVGLKTEIINGDVKSTKNWKNLFDKVSLIEWKII